LWGKKIQEGYLDINKDNITWLILCAGTAREIDSGTPERSMQG